MNYLIIPMYSMRSHKTGEYQLMYDSNTNIMLHRLTRFTKKDVVTITIPRISELFQLTELRNLLNMYKCEVKLKFLSYGIHAGDTRDSLDSCIDNDIDWNLYDHVECHIESIKPRRVRTKWDYMIFNSSVLHEERPYTDKHFTTILRTLDEGYHFDFSTKCQLEVIPEHLLPSAGLDVKFFQSKVFDVQINRYFDEDLTNELDKLIPFEAKFFPFRLSDKAYKFDKVYKTGPVVVTDPNESGIEHDNIINISNLHECKKTLYINMLILMRKRKDIRIPLYEDIDYNYHISIVEMVYYVPEFIDFMYTSDKKISKYLNKKYIYS